MIDEVFKKLNELGYKVYWQLRPETFPSLTYYFINEYGVEWTTEGEVETEILMQVDVWSKGDYTNLVKQVKDKLKEIEFYRLSEYDDFENDTQIYHKILRFTKLKNNESEVI